MAKLTDTQLVILSSASRRDDRGVDLPTNVTGEAVCKAVDKLIRTGLLEEVRANGSLLAWRRDAEAGPMALRITKAAPSGARVRKVRPAESSEGRRFLGHRLGALRKRYSGFWRGGLGPEPTGTRPAPVSAPARGITAGWNPSGRLEDMGAWGVVGFALLGSNPSASEGRVTWATQPAPTSTRLMKKSSPTRCPTMHWRLQRAERR
jgi:hypothetical protein